MATSQKILAALALLAAAATHHINAAKNESPMLLRDDIATSREIARIKTNLKQSKFYASQSAFESCIDTLGVTLLGAGVGTLAGLAQVMATDDREYGPGTALQVIFQIIQGTSSGFIFGIAGQAGSRPQLSKAKLLLFLILQSVATFGLMKFLETLIQTPNNNDLSVKMLIGVLSLITGLLAVVGECIVIRSMRHSVLVEKQALEEALSDLRICLKNSQSMIDY
jgi:hypothetical protein